MYRNNEFSDSFIRNAIRGISYLKALGRECAWDDWENIVARGMKATRKKSNNGLTDVYNDITAWSAKKINTVNPLKTKRVRLISGRINLNHLFPESNITNIIPQEVGKEVIETWNSRVFEARTSYNDIRTIILLITPSLDKMLFYEDETVTYDPNSYNWSWSEKKVLVGTDKLSNERKFSWIASGTQFHIMSDVPNKNVYVELPKINKLDDDMKMKILESVGFSFDNARILV